MASRPKQGERSFMDVGPAFLANGIVVHNKSTGFECIDDADCRRDAFCGSNQCTRCALAPPDVPKCLANDDAGIGGGGGAGGSAAAWR